MRTVILYESMFGNTRRIAEEIARGLAGEEVLVTRPADVTADQLATADLIVVGAPTHVHGLPRPSTRQGATEQATGDLRLEPDHAAAGIREWLESVPDGAGRDAAAFDTRVDISPILSGRASKSIAKALHHHGFRLIAEPESFLVDRQTQLLPGELDRARAWGRALAAVVAGTPA